MDSIQAFEIPQFAQEGREALDEVMAAMARGVSIHPKLAEKAKAYVTFVERYNEALSTGLNRVANGYNFLLDNKPDTVDELLTDFETELSSVFAGLKTAFLPTEPEED